MGFSAFFDYRVDTEFFSEFCINTEVLVKVTAHQNVLILFGTKDALGENKLNPAEYVIVFLFIFLAVTSVIYTD